ncbi:MAG: methyltransferase domain-containing protein [Infirmifilum sp.]
MSITVPFVPSPPELIKRAFEIAGLKPGELVLDPGCGDGRSLIIAAKEFGARAVGIELRKDLLETAMRRISEEGVSDRVLLIHGSFYDIAFPPADVVFLYLLTSVNERLRPKLERELKPTTRVVSHDFEVTGWKPVEAVTVEEGGRTHKIYFYIVGESIKRL